MNNATDIALGTDDKIATMTVKGLEGIRSVKIGLGLEGFFEEFIKYSNFILLSNYNCFQNSEILSKP